jgi:penicillin-binding protein 1A
VSRRLRAALAVAAVTAALIAAVAAAAWMSAPSGDRLPERVQLRLRGTGGRPTPLASVAPVLVRALVATEDERFYRHRGIDLIGIARALPYDLAHASLAQGASTLTEQVAKLLYLDGNDHSPWRKLEDMALAVKLENRYSKAQILAAYLDSAYFGAGAYGVRAASERYFGVAPRRLTLAQASLLAGLPQAPSAYDPLAHPAAARERQVDVLRSLVRTGSLSSAAAGRVLARPLRLRGAVLPALPSVRIEPGPPLAWIDALAGALLLGCGLLLLALRRRRGGSRLYGWVTACGGTAALVIGAAVVLRSFRTL